MPHKRAKRSVREAETAKKGSNLPPSTKALTSAYDDTPKSASRIISGWKFQSEFRQSGKTNSEDTGQPKPSTSSTSNSKGNDNAEKVNNNGKGKGKEEIPKILPNETLGEYNRRIETLLRGGVSKAIKDAASLKAAEAAQANRDKKVRKRKAKLEKLIKDGKIPKEALEKYLKEVREKELQKEKGKRKRNVDDDDDEEEEGEGGEKQTKKPIKEFREMEGPRRLNDIVQAPPQLPHLRKTGQSKGTGKEVYSAIGKDSGKIPLNAGQKRILEEERERVVRMYREMKARKEEGRKV